jgi:hypothetical protein
MWDVTGLMSEEASGDPREVMSPVRVYLERNQSVSKSRVDECVVLSQLGSCSGSVGGGILAWQRSAAEDPAVSGLSGLGLPLNYVPYLQSLKKRVAGNSNSQHSGCAEMVVFQEEARPIDVAGSGKAVCGSAEMEGDAGGCHLSIPNLQNRGFFQVTPTGLFSVQMPFIPL